MTQRLGKNTVFGWAQDNLVNRDYGPLRTCRACGRKARKNELIRWVAEQGEIVEDIKQNKTGRGVYCCPERTCRERLFKNKKKLKMVLRLQGDKEPGQE